MNKKTAIKLILLCLLSVAITVGCPVIGCFWGIAGVVAGFATAYILFLLIIIFCLPVWFKDYIEEFWQKQEDKDAQKTQ